MNSPCLGWTVRGLHVCSVVDQGSNHDDPGEDHEYGHEEALGHTRTMLVSAILVHPAVNSSSLAKPTATCLGQQTPPTLMFAGRAQAECSSARQFPATTAKPG